MQLAILLPRLKLEYLETALDTLCEQAAKEELGYREFLEQALAMEWQGRHQKGLGSRLK